MITVEVSLPLQLAATSTWLAPSESSLIFNTLLKRLSASWYLPCLEYNLANQWFPSATLLCLVPNTVESSVTRHFIHDYQFPKFSRLPFEGSLLLNIWLVKSITTPSCWYFLQHPREYLHKLHWNWAIDSLVCVTFSSDIECSLVVCFSFAVLSQFVM